MAIIPQVLCVCESTYVQCALTTNGAIIKLKLLPAFAERLQRQQKKISYPQHTHTTIKLKSLRMGLSSKRKPTAKTVKDRQQTTEELTTIHGVYLMR